MFNKMVRISLNEDELRILSGAFSSSFCFESDDPDIDIIEDIAEKLQRAESRFRE